MTESGIFKIAVKLAAEQRREFLEQACGVDTALRREVEALLEAHDNPESFLTVQGPIGEPTVEQGANSSSPGAVVGPYKLTQSIGEGGMGTVFMAEQTEPVRRLVALKIIKPGMDSRQVIARFEAERQALALMDHPNIARVLDAGHHQRRPALFRHGAGQGRADHQVLRSRTGSRPRQRLELFIPVCQAIQHAHQKGIIHRDLKPSNVLVAPVRRQAGAQGDRLRRGQGHRAAA